MSEHPNAPSSLADQVTSLAREVTVERADRQKASAERAEHRAAVDAWLSKKRAELVALIVGVPVLGLLIWTNITGHVLVDLLTPDPPQELARQRAQQALDAVVRDVHAYREDYAELPDSLAEVGASPQGEWTYAKGSHGNYRISLRMLGQVVTFDSAAPALGR